MARNMQVHGFRHAAAKLRRDAGESVENVSRANAETLQHSVDAMLSLGLARVHAALGDTGTANTFLREARLGADSSQSPLVETEAEVIAAQQRLFLTLSIDE
ncbi:MAG: hypothetical protein KKA32_12505 [Actinobacteria bacterium]|nr:hypothetical protein [Actinomycetota bacterium]